MVVFRAIGAFFARIWRWIKETAWIQPLLIVGIIFGVIFSIPPIVKGVKGIVDNISSTESYYRNFEVSLVNGASSKADELTIAVDKVMSGEAEDIASVKNSYGEKFFIMYVSKSCSSCAEAREGFEEFEKNFKSKYATSASDKKEADSINNGKGFKMYTIFTDEITSDTNDDETAFVQYMNRNSHFMENAAAAAYSSDYYLSGKISDADLFNVESCDPDEFLTPTIMLVDLRTAEEGNLTSTQPGVTDIMFGVSGSNKVTKAQLIADCWFHKGDFSLN